MCSIPGLPIPGSEVTVHITRVNLNPLCSVVELWGNFNQGRSNAYQHMKKEIQIPRLKFSESEGSHGGLCLVHLNETWHRARIISRNGNNYNVFLIDEGRAHITKSSTLAWGQNDCFLLPPEVEFCVLANVFPLSHANRLTSEFLKSFYGATVSGCVQDVLMPDRIILLHIPVISKHMYEVGFARLMPTDQFKHLVLSFLQSPKGEAEAYSSKSHNQKDAGNEREKSQQYLHPELQTETVETVEVTEVISPQRIFCKLSIFSQELKKLSAQIQEYYEERSSFCKTRPQSSGAPCAARGSNSKWYRSVLQQDIVSDGVVEVLHVDYGKTDFVQVGDIRPLDAKFLRMPVVTYVCSLHGIKDKGIGWRVNQIDYLKSVLMHQTVIARFEDHDASEGIYHVTLYGSDKVNINHLFGEEKCILESEFHENSSVHNGTVSTKSLKTLGNMDYQNPFNLNIEHLQGNINTLLCSEGLPINVRKEVLSHGRKPFGFPTTQVKQECSVTELQGSGCLSPCSHSTTENVLNEHLFLIGSSVEVKLSCIENPANFWCQIAQHTDSLMLLMEHMQDHYATAHPQQPVESICVARHPDNGMWYRACIVANHQSPLVDVRFVDYGHTRKVPLQDMRPIPPAFLRLKAQAFQCCLPNLLNSSGPAPAAWSDIASAEFHNFIDSAVSSNVGLKCTINAVMYDSQGVVLNVVDIETPFQSACKLLVQKERNAPAHLKQSLLSPVLPDPYNYSAHNIEVSGTEKIWISCAKSVSQFYGQLGRNSHVIEELAENVQQLCHQPHSTDFPLVLETACFAKYTDNQWYRGQLKATHPNLQVHFVDYGDILEVNHSDILPFPVEANIVRSVPVQAIPLELFNVPVDISHEFNSWFGHHATGNSFTISVVAKDSSGKLIVELYDGTVNVNMIVREKWKEEMLKHSLVQGTVNTVLMQQPSWVSKQQTSSKLIEENKTASQSWGVGRRMENVSEQSSTGMYFEHEQRKVGQSTSEILASILENKPGGKTMTDHGKKACSIAKITDLPPRVLKQGLVTEVYVSHCNCPSSFFVQLTNEENDIYSVVEKLNSSEAFCDVSVDLSELQIGDLVNAEYPDDSSWYRAVVRDKCEDGTIHVEFIDFGNDATISSLKVCQLDKSVEEFPRFSIHCTLGGISSVNKHKQWDEESISMFKKVTTENVEKKFACTFIKETESVWHISLEDHGVVLTEALVRDSQTEKSNTSQLSFSGQNMIPQMYKKPNISQGQAVDVYASSIVGPQYFWCQYTNSEELNKISRIAQEIGNMEEEDIRMDTLSPGSPCLALFAEDKQWYRAQIIRKAGDVFTVVFIDYGNESEVDLKAIKSIPCILLENAPQAFLCSLDGFEEGSWDDSAVDVFYELLVDKPLQVIAQKMSKNADSLTAQYQVKMYSNNQVLNDLMRKYWHCSDSHAHSEKPKCNDMQQLAITEYKCSTQDPTHSHQPLGEVQINATLGPQPSIAGSLLDHTEGSPAVSMSRQQMDSYPPLESGDEKAICFDDLGEDLSSGSNASIESLPKLENLPSRSIRPGLVTDVYISECNSPSSFFVQLVEDENDLFSLAERLNAGKSDDDVRVNIAHLQQGDVVNSEFPDDSSWYRAIVLGTNGEETVHVQYIDFGNEATVSSLKVCRLDTQSLELPRLSIHCSLSGLSDISAKVLEQEVVCQFKKVAGDGGEKKLTCKFIKETGSVWEVCLMDQNVIVADLLKLCSDVKAPQLDINDPQNPSSGDVPSQMETEPTVPLQFKKTDILLGQTVDMRASSITGPHYFWCQYANYEELNKIAQVSQEIGNTEEDMICMATLSPGSPCLALFAEDKQWYRAQIIRKAGDVFTVVFMDYGNESEVDLKALKSIPLTLLESTPQAFLCSLEGFEEGTWDDSAVDVFYELLVDKQLKVTVQKMDYNAECLIPQYKVEVECEDLVLNELMKKYWKISAPEDTKAIFCEAKESLLSSDNPSHSVSECENRGQNHSRENPKDNMEAVFDSDFSTSIGIELDIDNARPGVTHCFF